MVVGVDAAAPFGRPLRVLLADEDKLFSESLMTVLSEDDRVDVVGIAANGSDAVKLAVDLTPDVIVMDLKMPIMDGLEATRRIRAAGVAAHVLLLTGTESPIGAADATAAGANAFLRKERGIYELREVFFEVASFATLLGAAAR